MRTRQDPPAPAVPTGDATGRPLLLMAHGSTYSSGATFDLPVEGVSMMDAMADAEIEAWAIDMVGYGGSSRPAAMKGDPSAAQPLTRTADAVLNLAAAVDYLLARYGRRSLALLGWSWGTAICGAYTASNAGIVDHLIQLAPLWLRAGPSATDPGGPIGAYRIVEIDGIESRWLRGLPPSAIASLIPPGTVSTLTKALLASDASYSTRHPGRIRAPNGTVADTRAYWSAGHPLYDPAAITCPTLVACGEWDQEWSIDIARTYAERLTEASRCEFQAIPEATHSLLLERNRRLIYGSVAKFLLSPSEARRD